MEKQKRSTENKEVKINSRAKKKEKLINLSSMYQTIYNLIRYVPKHS